MASEKSSPSQPTPELPDARAGDSSVAATAARPATRLEDDFLSEDSSEGPPVVAAAEQLAPSAWAPGPGGRLRVGARELLMIRRLDVDEGVLSDTVDLDAFVTRVMSWATTKDEAFSKLALALDKCPNVVSCGRVSFDLGRDHLDRLCCPADDACGTALLVAATISIPLLFVHMDLDKVIDGRLEPPHRSLIDPIFILALHLAQQVRSSEIPGDAKRARLVVTSEAKQESATKGAGVKKAKAVLRGPLDYSLAVMKRSAEKRVTLFAMEAKQWKEYPHALLQLRLQLLCLRDIARAAACVDPICGVASDGIRYQFLVLGATMFFESPVFGVAELRQFFRNGSMPAVVACRVADEDWLPMFEIAEHIAALMVGRVALEMRYGWSAEFTLAYAMTEGFGDTDWSGDCFREPLRQMMPLHVAARKGMTELVEWLLLRKHPLLCRDGSGRTPLWWAAKKGHFDTFQLLLTKQEPKGEPVDILHRAADGTTVLTHLKSADAADALLRFLTHFRGCLNSNAESIMEPFTRLWMRDRTWHYFALWEDGFTRDKFGVSSHEQPVTDLGKAMAAGFVFTADDWALITLPCSEAEVIKNAGHISAGLWLLRTGLS